MEFIKLSPILIEQHTVFFSRCVLKFDVRISDVPNTASSKLACLFLVQATVLFPIGTDLNVVEMF